MTESEAKQKWCPMVKYELGGRAVNRDACYDNAGTHCIASDCAMWRVNRVPQDYPTIKVTFDGQQLSTQQVDIVDFGGYCGLAGKP
jgi:hypothetical protein